MRTSEWDACAPFCPPSAQAPAPWAERPPASMLAWFAVPPLHPTMRTATLADPAALVLQRIVDRAFAQTMAMIHVANHRPEKRRGDPKVGGHPASCASSMHLLSA